MKLKRLMPLVLIVLCAGLLLGGCTSKRVEEQNAYKEQGVNALVDGKYEDALSDFNKALEKSEHRVGAREVDICFYKGAAQYALKDSKGALATYQSLIDYDDTDPRPYYLMGSVYLLEKETQKAKDNYLLAVQHSDDDYELYIQIYYNLEEQGYHDEALEFLNLALEIEGNTAYHNMQRGRIYMILAQYDAAEKALTKAIDKGESQAMIYLSSVYAAENETDKANEQLEKYVKKGDITSESCNVMGDLYFQQQKYKDALKLYQKGLSLNKVTNKKQLLKNEVAAYEYTGDYKTAYKKAQSYIKAYPYDSDMIRELEFLQTR